MTAGVESVSIRAAERRDAAAIAALSDELGYPVETAALGTRLGRLLESPDDGVFVAADPSDRVVGWVHVFAAQRLETATFAELGGLVVATDWRRRGVGRGLVARAGGWAAARSIGRLRVRSNRARGAAHAFYAGLGFALVKDQAVYERPTREA